MTSTSMSLAASCWLSANEPYKYASSIPSIFFSAPRIRATAPIVLPTIQRTSEISRNRYYQLT